MWWRRRSPPGSRSRSRRPAADSRATCGTLGVTTLTIRRDRRREWWNSTVDCRRRRDGAARGLGHGLGSGSGGLEIDQGLENVLGSGGGGVGPEPIGKSEARNPKPSLERKSKRRKRQRPDLGHSSCSFWISIFVFRALRTGSRFGIAVQGDDGRFRYQNKFKEILEDPSTTKESWYRLVHNYLRV